MSMHLADWLPLIQSLGWTLLHFLWQGALIGLGYALVRLLVPPERVETRYAAGLLALALMAASPFVTLTLIYPQSLDAAAVSAVTATELAPMTIGVDGVAAVPATELALDRWLPWLVLIWVLGVVIMARRALRQWRELERIAKRCARTSPELQRALARLAERFGVLRNIRVLISEHIDTPTLIGWIKPVILVPTAVALGFPRQQVELILAHELGHLRRYDHLVNLAQAVVEMLLFYHPAVHWISREVRNDREVCCDRLVLRLTGGEPREYAQTLASLEELRISVPRLAVAATGGVLLDRVRHIIDMPVPRLAAARPSRGLTLFAVIAVVLMGVALSRPERKDLDALAAGANALLERLPRPDAAMLVGLALQVEPPKWTATAPKQPRLAIVANTEKPQAPSALPAVDPNASHVVSVDALPKPRPGVTDAMLWKHGIGPVADVRIAEPASVLGDRQNAALPTVNVTQKSSVTPRAKRLVAVRSVSPRYPDVGRVSAPVRVDVEFAVGADGSVQDVTVIGDAERPFALAAKKAMGQWRFDPASAPTDANVRFQQSFVFAKQSDVRRSAKPSDGEEFDCVRRTGSLVCRHPQEEEVALPLTIIDGNADADIPAHP
jgi:beta-lactamase regulating signal transducer with metallopeptidase domain